MADIWDQYDKLQRIQDMLDGGVGQKLAMFKKDTALSAAMKYMEQQHAAMKRIEDSLGLGRSWSAYSAMTRAATDHEKMFGQSSAFGLANQAYEDMKRLAMGSQIAARYAEKADFMSKYALRGPELGFVMEARSALEKIGATGIVADAASRLGMINELAGPLARAVPPFVSDARRLNKELGTLSRRQAWEQQLSTQMKAMNGSWMLPDDPARSMLGYAHLTKMANALRHAPPYSPELNRLIEEELGGIAEAGEEDTPEDRDGAAVNAGMRPELIAFPPSAFPIVVGSTKLILSLPPLPVPQPIHGTNPGARYDHTHKVILAQVEVRLRLFVEEALGKADGSDWLVRRVHGSCSGVGKSVKRWNAQRRASLIR